VCHEPIHNSVICWGDNILVTQDKERKRNIMKLFKRRGIAALSAIAITLGLAACGSGGGSSSSAAATAKDGGTIHIALTANVTSLDPLINGAYVGRDTMRNIYEGLVSLKQNGEVGPVLAKSYSVSKDNKTFTFKIRNDVKFQNGETMKAEDVVASLQRWVNVSQFGQTWFTGSTVTSPDPDTVVLQSPKPMAAGLHLIADPGRMAAIMPKSVIDAATPTGVKEYIGTGPYKVKEYVQDQKIVLTKWAGYKSPTGKPDGYVGEKTPHADNLEFDIATDGNTRLAGTLSGQYHVGYALADSLYSQIKSNNSVHVETDPMIDAMVFNKKQGVFANNQKLRQAVLAAMDMTAVDKAAHLNSDLYTVDGGLMPKGNPARSNVDLEKYNHPDLAKAKQLVKDSGYNGEKITLMTTKDYQSMYNASVEFQNQLKALGLNIELKVVDWGTAMQQFFVPDQWDMATTSWSVPADPLGFSFFQKTGQGWNTDPAFFEIADEINASTSPEQQKAGYDKLQKWYLDYVPGIIITHYKQINAVSNKVAGYQNGMQGPAYYSMQLKQ
jgi:peptide/nickel transport system substrate-binding protein